MALDNDCKLSLIYFLEMCVWQFLPGLHLLKQGKKCQTHITFPPILQSDFCLLDNFVLSRVLTGGCYDTTEFLWYCLRFSALPMFYLLTLRNTPSNSVASLPPSCLNTLNIKRFLNIWSTQICRWKQNFY